MKDPWGRIIDYMRISITDRCNLRCKYCMPEGIDWIPMDEILTLEEIAARKRGREDEHDVVILDSDDDEDAAGPSNPPRQPKEGCSRDGGGTQHCGNDDDDGGGDYTRFYRLLGM